MNKLKWILKIPVIKILVIILLVYTIVAVDKVKAASGMPEFGQIIASNLEALMEFFKINLEILALIW